MAVETLSGTAGGFPSYVADPARPRRRDRTVVYAARRRRSSAPIDPFQVRYAARLASALGARVVLPDYPLTPEHTWRDSLGPVVDLVERLGRRRTWCSPATRPAAGSPSAVALTLRDRGGPQPTHLLLHSPWVDLTISTPETARSRRATRGCSLGKLQAYAEWWAGSPDDLGRPEVSPRRSPTWPGCRRR